MSFRESILVGYSGHSYVIAEIAEENGFRIKGYVDITKKSFNPMNYNYLGIDSAICKLKKYSLIIGIGNFEIRKKIVEFFLDKDFVFETIISKNTLISKSAKIDSGSFINKNVSINSFVKIGKFTVINTSAVIEHECIINDFVHIAPGAVLNGKVYIGKNSLIGSNATVNPGIKIGENCTVGSGSTVIHDIPNNQTWVGSPAKRIK